MYHLRLLCLLAGGLLGPVIGCAEEATFSCSIISDGPGEVIYQGIKQATPLYFADCTGVIVNTGEVSACFVDEQGSRECVAVEKGTTLRADVLKASSTTVGSFGAELIALLTGDNRARTGQTRGSLYSGIPTGPVLAFALPYEITLTETWPNQQGTFRLQLVESGKEVYVSPIWDRRTRIDALEMIMGQRFRWIVEIGGESTVGQFRIAGNEYQDVYSAVEDIGRKEGVTEIERLFLLASIFDDAGLLYDRDHTLLNLQKHLN